MKVEKPLSIYLHVPFCESRCHYCDFYSNTDCSAELKNKYTKALINTLAAPISRDEYVIKSVYFGGGTPALLGEANISNVLEKIYKNYTLDKNCEITLETNPYSAGKINFNLLSKNGINRVSVGIQSLHDDVLMEIGRSHDRVTALSCLNMLCETDIERISADMMFGLPEQNIEMLLEDLEIITAYGNRIGHISLYDLKLEPGTRMYERRNMFSFPVDDEEADMYFAGFYPSTNHFRKSTIPFFQFISPKRTITASCHLYLPGPAGIYVVRHPQRTEQVQRQ